MFRKTTKAQIVFAVVLDKQNYEIGEQINGNILFRKDRSVKFEKIRARFIGTTQYAASADKLKSRSVLENSEFLTIADKGKLPEGDSMYPIRFSVPASLPPSILHPPAEIKYEIQAELLFKGGKSITSSVDIYIHQPIQSSSVPTTFTEKKDWGIIHKETLLIRCIPDKTVYLPEETIILDFNLNNMTKKDLVRVVTTVECVLKCEKKVNGSTNICNSEVPRDSLPVVPNTK